jgi:hypothetical protein
VKVCVPDWAPDEERSRGPEKGRVVFIDVS